MEIVITSILFENLL